MRELNDLFWKHRDRDTPPRELVASYGHQFFPEEILAALHVDGINLIIGGQENLVVKGTDYLTPTSCIYSRQMIGFFEEMQLKATGLPPINHLVRTNFCSGDYHAGEIVGRYFGVKLHALSVPYKVSPQAFLHVSNHLSNLIDELCEALGKEYSDDALARVIKESNDLRDKFAIYSSIAPPGMEKLHVFYEVALAPWDAKPRIIDRAIRSNEGNTGSRLPSDRSRVNIVLTGSPIMIGDKFISILDAFDISIKFYDFYFGDQYALKKIPENPEALPILGRVVDFSDPIQVIAAYLLEVIAPERIVQGSQDHLANRMSQALHYERFLPAGEKIHGVVNHVLKFCDVYGPDRTTFKVKMQEQRGIQVLDIERDFAPGAAGQISTRVEAFHEMLMHDIQEGGK